MDTSAFLGTVESIVESMGPGPWPWERHDRGIGDLGSMGGHRDFHQPEPR